MAVDEAKPFARGQVVYISRDARDMTGMHLFGVGGYGFPYRPPFRFVAVGEDGDLIVADSGGEEMDVSPEYADWELELMGKSNDPNAPLHEPDDIVNHPSHYQSATGLEAIEVIEAFDLGYGLGNATKYILRAGKKGTAEDAVTDLEKSMFYIRREIAKRKEALR